MKAILVIDNPKNCEECPLSLEIKGQYNTNICRGCDGYRVNLDSKKKPQWCPLKETLSEKHNYDTCNNDSCRRKCEKDGYNRGIEKFAEAIKNSKDAHAWSCRDLALEFCDADNCEGCLEKFKKRIDEIAEKMKNTGRERT